ncbi:MAG: protein-methionine-sulfoxide reductase catalytic subunit MsrP [Planctomycetaceae bacterium]|nr:protein-methionine-sulfoxide reductase catalytic subunit MsrP [Planctomycetaceae bacterium]
MMQYHIRRPWQLHESRHTPESVWNNRRQHRREFLQSVGRSAAAAGLAGSLIGCREPATEEEILSAGSETTAPLPGAEHFPAPRNPMFEYGREETSRRDAAEYSNFYEFTTSKEVWRYIGDFQPVPWAVTVDGLCRNPQTFDLDDLYRNFTLEERDYRFRCVETWAMCVPWTGFTLRELLQKVDPLPDANYVAFETFDRPEEAPTRRKSTEFPWPYREGLSLEEARNELTLLATGVFGQPLPKQHGAPVRLVLPWKYGFKSIKSIVRITLTKERPPTFWNEAWPDAYGFIANVEPDIPHPSWPQTSEWMLGTRERHETVRFNGYGEFVGHLYPA